MIENIPMTETLAKVLHVLQSCNFLDFLKNHLLDILSE